MNPSLSTELLLEIGTSLSRERDANELLMIILDAAMDITNADGGTLYIVEQESLHFHILATRSRGILRCAQKESIGLPPVPFGRQNVCGYCAVTRSLINIDDVYESERFDFEGPRQYDSITGYRTQSMMVVPMENDQGEIIGVLQLINAQDDRGNIISFDEDFEPVVRSLASQAAIRLANVNYATEVTELLDSFVRVMSSAIDARSPYNANHTRNMVVYANRFIDRLHTICDDWDLAEKRKPFIMSVWLHDIGKLVIPLEIMDKNTRLGDRLGEIGHRFDLMRMWNSIDLLNGTIDDAEHAGRTQKIREIESLILATNQAGFLPDDRLEQIKALGAIMYRDIDGQWQPLLDEGDISSLCIRRGTLSDDERELMQSHVKMTRIMLDNMSFSKSYSDVPVWAAMHHEMLNGTGYPNHLTEGDISREVRLLAIIDIFDALTAQDRPYKPPMSPEDALQVLDGMVRSGQLDANILSMFKTLKPWDEQADIQPQ